MRNFILLLLLCAPGGPVRAVFTHQLVNLIPAHLPRSCSDAVVSFFDQRYEGGGTVVIDALRLMGSESRLGNVLEIMTPGDPAVEAVINAQRKVLNPRRFKISPLTEAVFRRWRTNRLDPQVVAGLAFGQISSPTFDVVPAEFIDFDTLFWEAELVNKSEAEDRYDSSGHQVNVVNPSPGQTFNLVALPVSSWFPPVRDGGQRRVRAAKEGAKEFWVASAHETRHHEDWLFLKAWVNANRVLRRMGWGVDPLFNQYVRDERGTLTIDRGFYHLFLETNAWFTDLEISLILEGRRGELFDDNFELRRKNHLADLFDAAEEGSYPVTLVRAIDHLAKAKGLGVDPRDFDLLYVGQLIRERMLDSIERYTEMYQHRHSKMPQDVHGIDFRRWEIPKRRR